MGEKVTVVMESLYGFVERLYDWNYTGLVQDNNEDDDKEEKMMMMIKNSVADFVINTRQ